MKPCIYCGTIKREMREFPKIKILPLKVVDSSDSEFEPETFFVCVTCLFDVMWMENNMLKHPPSEEFENEYGERRDREIRERLNQLRDMVRRAKERADDILEDDDEAL